MLALTAEKDPAVERALPAQRLPRSIAEHIAATAAAALLAELDTWPKPGLVSHHDTGSHNDMDAGTFMASTAAIQPFYAELAHAGANRPTMDVLRDIGRRAEGAMLQATAGVNTHRGAIFGLGLLCAAAGALWPDARTAEPRWPAQALGETVRQRWAHAIEHGPLPLHSHGTAVLRQHGAGGARAQAAAGFPQAIEVGLPALRAGRRMAQGDAQAARVQAFFALLASMEDTNLLYRGGTPGLHFAQRAAARFLGDGGVAQSHWRARAIAVHREFVARRLSPGGCGDLLAVTLLLDALEAFG